MDVVEAEVEVVAGICIYSILVVRIFLGTEEGITTADIVHIKNILYKAFYNTGS